MKLGRSKAKQDGAPEEGETSFTPVGNAGLFQTLNRMRCEATGTETETAAMQVHGVGSLVRVTTRSGEAIAVAVTFVPKVRVVGDVVSDGENGAKLEGV